MSENPYQSPAAAPASVDDDSPERQLGAWLMVPVGAVLGAATGAIAGGLGGLLLGTVFYSMYPSLTYMETFAAQRPLIAIMAWVLFAAYVSGLAGTVLGGILGLDAGIRPARLRRRYLIGAIAGGTLIGAVIGMLRCWPLKCNPLHVGEARRLMPRGRWWALSWAF